MSVCSIVMNGILQEYQVYSHFRELSCGLLIPSLVFSFQSNYSDFCFLAWSFSLFTVHLFLPVD